METHCCSDLIGGFYASKEGIAAQHAFGVGTFLYFCDVCVCVWVCVCDCV